MHFVTAGTFTRYGSWGAIEYTSQPVEQAPKYLALREYFNANKYLRTVKQQLIYVCPFIRK
jgi:hypothetical protein